MTQFRFPVRQCLAHKQKVMNRSVQINDVWPGSEIIKGHPPLLFYLSA